jgi:5'-3' exonuclease
MTILTQFKQRLDASGALTAEEQSVALLFDGDILAYRAAAATDGRKYTCADGVEFTYKREADKHTKDKGLTVAPKLTYEPEPMNHATHNIRTMIDACKAEFSEEKVYCFFFLSGKDQFRSKVNSEYKANREDMRRPENLKGCKTYLELDFDAMCVEPYEADDLLGIANEYLKKEFKVIPHICSIDKDLMMLPGNHFHIVNLEKSEVDERTGLLNLYSQILQGDRTDNIEGLKGIGPKKAEKALVGCDTEKSFAEAALKTYFDVMGHDADPRDVIKELLKTAHQVFILRNEGEYYKMPVIERYREEIKELSEEYEEVLR